MSILDKEYIRQFITNDVKLEKDLNGKELKNFKITGEEDTDPTTKQIKFNKKTGKLQIHVASGGNIASTTLTKEFYSNAKKIKCELLLRV